MSEELEIAVLEHFLKAMKGPASKIRIGILQNSPRKKSKQTNAEIGARHEFGSDGMPVRSFLRMPLSEHLDKYLEKAGAFDAEALKKIAQDGSLLPWAKKVAVVAEEVVQDAFATQGFGKWPGWKTPGYENNTGMVLVDTQQLRNSITSEVK